MKRVALEVGAARIHARDQMSGTNTGSHHYLRAPSDGLDWRVRGEVVHYEFTQQRPGVKDCERICRCRKCRQLKLRRGGSNRGHVFICKECR
jgi:hypothetical protein